MSKNNNVPYEENDFAKFFFSYKEDYDSYVNFMDNILESGEKQDTADLAGEMRDYLDLAKEQLSVGNKILAAFYYGNANAISEFLHEFYDVPPEIIDSTIGNDFMLLDHELFSDADF